jgi:hypothetical protein
LPHDFDIILVMFLVVGERLEETILWVKAFILKPMPNSFVITFDYALRLYYCLGFTKIAQPKPCLTVLNCHIDVNTDISIDSEVVKFVGCH